MCEVWTHNHIIVKCMMFIYTGHFYVIDIAGTYGFIINGLTVFII